MLSFTDFLKGHFSLPQKCSAVFLTTLIVEKVILISSQSPRCYNKRPCPPSVLVRDGGRVGY